LLFLNKPNKEEKEEKITYFFKFSVWEALFQKEIE